MLHMCTYLEAAVDANIKDTSNNIQHIYIYIYITCMYSLSLYLSLSLSPYIYI